MMIVFSRFRRAATIAGCAIALSLAAAGAAQAQTSAAAPSSAARFAAEATSYQNASIAKAMAYFPGGTRVSPSEVTWPGGAVLSVGASPSTSAALADSPDFADDCPGGYFCVATGANYTGNNWAFLNGPDAYGEAYWIAWGACPDGPGCDIGIHSWANNSGYRTWLEQFQDHGNELCISSGNSNSDYNGPDWDDYWILMSANRAAC
jgi:hypothetical protein